MSDRNHTDFVLSDVLVIHDVLGLHALQLQFRNEVTGQTYSYQIPLKLGENAVAILSDIETEVRKIYPVVVRNRSELSSSTPVRGDATQTETEGAGKPVPHN